MSKIVRTIDIHAPIELAFDTICDFEAYPSFLEGMRDVKVLLIDESRAKVRFTLDLFKRIVYTLDFSIRRPTELLWTLAEAEMIKRNDGGWKLSSKGDSMIEAEYSIDIDFKIWVPGPISTFLISTSIPATLESFKREIEKRAQQSS